MYESGVYFLSDTNSSVAGCAACAVKPGRLWSAALAEPDGYSVLVYAGNERPRDPGAWDIVFSEPVAGPALDAAFDIWLIAVRTVEVEEVNQVGVAVVFHCLDEARLPVERPGV